MKNNGLYRRMQSWGSHLISYYYFFEEIGQDFWNNRHTTLGQKLWAYRRGFRSSKIIMYGLNEDNYGQYMSGLDFHRMRSVNGYYRRWIDDKLTMKYVLHAFDEHLPAYYYLLEEGKHLRISKLPDCPVRYGTEANDIIGLLESQGSLAVKLLAGSLGVGFYKLGYENGCYLVNEKPVDRGQLAALLSGLRSYIITEYLTGHSELGAICGYRANSVRVMTMKQVGTPTLIVGALMRFATEESGTVDNISAGGVVALVDIDTGRFFNGRRLAGDEWQECPIHPDTGIALDGYVPSWKQIKETVTAICNYLPELVWLGFDIMVLDHGYKVIEINSQPGIALHNYYQPIYADQECRHRFKQAIAWGSFGGGFGSRGVRS